MTRMPTSLLRNREHPTRVTMVELFFDLVFVFAVTQFSHTLSEHLSLRDALLTGLLFLSVWWLWIYTTWATNWLEPDRIPVRLLMLLLMLGGLVLSASIPQAFGERGLWFAGALAAMHLIRNVFLVVAFRRGGRPAQTLNFVRILAWLVLTGTLWIIGGLAAPDARIGWWLAAVAIEYIGPAASFWTPGLGRSSTQDWDVDGAHMAERCMLFVIIALGESLLVTGATFAGLEWNRDAVVGFAIAFIGSVAMWWIYFDTGADRASERIASSNDPGRVARIAYTYLHLPIIAGIIVCAVSDASILAHPRHVTAATAAAIVGGPALYLLGTAAFKWVTSDRLLPPLSHLLGLALLAALAVVAWKQAPSPLALAGAATATLLFVATWETVALRRQPGAAKAA